MSGLWWMMQRSTSGAHLVCVWAEPECCTCRGHLWSWTPVFVPVWAFNSSFWSVSGAGRQNWAENWRWTPVYIVYPYAKYRLLYIAGKPWMSTFQRNWKHAISSSVAPENPLWVQGGQNPTASESFFNLWVWFLLTSLNFSQKIPEITEKYTNS